MVSRHMGYRTSNPKTAAHFGYQDKRRVHRIKAIIIFKHGGDNVANGNGVKQAGADRIWGGSFVRQWSGTLNILGFLVMTIKQILNGAYSHRTTLVNAGARFITDCIRNMASIAAINPAVRRANISRHKHERRWQITRALYFALNRLCVERRKTEHLRHFMFGKLTGNFIFLPPNREASVLRLARIKMNSG